MENEDFEFRKSEMKLRSLGYQSELIFTSFDGKVEDRGSYLVVRTLTNPNFFWGNLLIFDTSLLDPLKD